MLSDHEVFWLARYAHNQLAPLFAEVKALDSSIRFSIEMVFANPDRPYTEGHLEVRGHWARNKPVMFLQKGHLFTKADIDQLAQVVKDKIAHLHLDAALAELPELTSV